MSIRLKIVVFQVVVALMLLGTAAVTCMSVARIDRHADQTRLARDQMDMTLRLSAHVNRYAETLAETQLLGRTELGVFYAARRDVGRSLATLTTLVERKAALATTDHERAERTTELVRVRTMRQLFDSIDSTAERLTPLRDQDRQTGAVVPFREDVKDRLNLELAPSIKAAIIDGETELEAIEDRTDRLERRLVLLAFGVSLAAVVVPTIAGAWLAHALMRPIEALTSAARAIGRGDLGHRIASDGTDEFSELGAQVNAAAARLEERRGELLELQARLETTAALDADRPEDTDGRLRQRRLVPTDVGYDLRAPLTALRSEAEAALQGERTVDDHRKTFGRVVVLTQQMDQLVEDLLFLSRADAAVIGLEMELLGMQDVLDVAVREARALAVANDLLLHAQLPDQPCRIAGDAERLSRAVLIVIDNAVRCSDPGQRVDLALDRTGCEAVISIKHIGPDIPASDLPFFFNHCYRDHQPVTRPKSGERLRLSVAKWILDRYDGRIEIASAGGETVVRLHLPLIA